MKSFFNKTNVNNYLTALRYDKLNFNDYINSIYNDGFNFFRFFNVILKFKKDILINEKSIRNAISKFNDDKIEIHFIEITNADKFKSYSSIAIISYIVYYYYYFFHDDKFFKIVIKQDRKNHEKLFYKNQY